LSKRITYYAATPIVCRDDGVMATDIAIECDRMRAADVAVAILHRRGSVRAQRVS